MTNRRARKIHEEIGKSQWKTMENNGKQRSLESQNLYLSRFVSKFSESEAWILYR